MANHDNIGLLMTSQLLGKKLLDKKEITQISLSYNERKNLIKSVMCPLR